MITTFNLHFTDFCNFHCKHCFVKKNGKELDIDNIKEIVNKLVSFSIKTNIKIRINLAGGEPLLSKNIQEIIDYIYSVGLDISLITNGYYLTKEFIINNKNKLSMIGISVDSLCHNTNTKIGRECNGVTLSKDELFSKCILIKENGIRLKINSCINQHNVNEDIKELLNEVKPDRIKILRVYCSSDTNLNISDEEWNRAKSKYNNAIFEDNEFMAKNYLIIDSEGNLSKNNLHITNNSLLDNTVEQCLENLNRLEGQQCQ